MASQHGKVGVDAQENARAQVRVDHALDVMERLVRVPEISMDDCSREVRERRHRGRIGHQLEALAPVGLGPAGAKRFGQSQTVHRHAPAWLLRDDRGGLFILAKRFVRRRHDVAGFLEAGNDLARPERLPESINRTAGEVMDPRDADVGEE